MKLISWIELPNLGDHRGSLVVVEANKSLPFEIKRLYYIFDSNPDTPRGFHAHHKLTQVAFCIQGKFKMLMDDGNEKQEVILDEPNKGLVIPPMVWHEMHDFSEDCIILVLADDYYHEDDYIRDYKNFSIYTNLKLVNYDKVFLDKSWEWLNDQEIKSLTMTPSFSKEDQYEFFITLDKRNDYYINGISYDGIPIGACGLKNISDDKAELWLYIGEKSFWGKGLGKKIMYSLELKAQNKGINKIYLKVSKENIKAINMYSRLNYKFSGEYVDYITMEKLL